MPLERDLPKSAFADRLEVAREVLELCRNELRETRDKAKRARLHYECARLSEMPLADWDAALEHYQQARTLSSRYGPTLTGLRRVRLLRGDWEAAQKALAEEIEVAGNPAERAALAFLRGVIFEQRLGRASDARSAYAQALSHLPGDAASLRALLRVARRERKAPEVRRLLEHLADSASEDPGLHASRLAQRARAAEQKEQETGEVLPFYLRSIEADPLATAALAHAERLSTFAGQFQQLVDLGRKKVQLLVDAERRAAGLLHGAEVTAERLGDRSTAIALLEQATAEVPGDGYILSRLADLYRQQGDHNGELRSLLKLESLQEEKAARVELRLRIAELYRHRMDSVGDAIVWFEKARELAPSHPGAADSLAELYRQREDFQGLAHVLAGREAESDDLGLRAALNLELAELYEKRLGDPDEAVARLKSAVGLVPEHPGAFRALTRLLHEQRRFSELAEVHEAAFDRAADDAEAITHLLSVAQIAEDLLSAPGQALICYQRILERDPKHLLAVRGVQRVAVTAGQHDVAISALEREAELHKSNADKVPLLLRAAEVAERHAGSVEQAIETYARVVQLDPRCRPALHALGRLHRGLGQYADLVSVMQVELEILDGRHAKAEQLLRIGQIAEDLLGDDGLALEMYRRALTEVPESHHAATCVERTLNRRGEHRALARMLETRIRHEKESAYKLLSALQLARIYELWLEKPKEALLAYSIAVETDETNQVGQDGMARMLSVLGEHKELAQVLDRQADSARDPATVIWANLQAAEVLEEKLGQAEQAALRYERVLELRSDHRGALDNLERLYADLGRADDLNRILGRQAEVYLGISERVASLREMMRVSEVDGPSAEQERVLAAERILALVPEDERALGALELAFIHRSEAARLAEVDRVRLEGAQSADVRSILRTRLGEYLEAHNPEQALALHRPALAEDPENVGAARGLTRLAEQLGRVDLLIEAAENESRVVQNSQRASFLFRSAAEIEMRSQRTDRAVEVLLRCLFLHPDDAACAQDLQRLLSSQGRQLELIQALEEAAGRAHRPEVRAGHWISVARLLADARGDLPAAIAALLRVEKAQPGHFATLIELAELYIRDRQWAAAVTRLEKALAASDTERESLSARLRLAEIYHEHLDRTADATRLLREVLRADPENRPALRRLLYVEVEQGKPSARETAEAWVKVSSGAELAEALTTLGRLQRDARQTKEATESMARALELVGYQEQGAGRDLVRLFEADEKRGKSPDWLLFTRALEDYCKSSIPDGDRALSHLELARAYFDHLSQPAEGVAVLRRGLSQVPGEVALLWELGQRLVALREHAQALPELRRLILVMPEERSLWSLLTETYDALGRNAEAHLAAGILIHLGGGSPLQHSTWRSRQARPATGHEGAVAPTLAGLAQDALPQAAQGLLSLMSPLLPKVFPQELAKAGLTARDRVGPRGAHPVRPLLDRLLRLFRGVDLDLYPSTQGERMKVVLTDPPGVVLPPHFAGLTESLQTFCLAHVAASVAVHAQVVVAHGIPALGGLLAATCVACGVPAIGGGSEATGSDLSRRVAKALPWLSKGRYEEAARRLGALADFSPDAAAEGLRLVAFRIAMVVADDTAPLGFLLGDGQRLLGLTPEAAERVYRDLLSFWVSDEAMHLRRDLGLT